MILPPVTSVAPETLAAHFARLAGRFSPDEQLVGVLWTEIEAAYSGPKRHYHNLAHLTAMLGELEPLQAAAGDWAALLFALFYHDAVYQVPGSGNEAQSAALAATRLGHLGVPAAPIARCRAHILATQRHEPSDDPDTNLLTDADLAILGRPWPAYEAYTRQVRAEYRRYPDLLYNPGRRKVLRQFLDRPSIYKTPAFLTRYEAAARANLLHELALL